MEEHATTTHTRPVILSQKHPSFASACSVSPIPHVSSWSFALPDEQTRASRFKRQKQTKQNKGALMNAVG
jgi:hypothetical protein